MDKHLHIVTHDVPWPVDYGGVVDLFYKIKALHNLGIKIHLHCFTKGRTGEKILNNYCESVHYYLRKKGIAGISFRVPYIVKSRSDVTLLKNLEQDNYPILLEGIHCTYFFDQLKGRRVFIRLHNVEYRYYNQLAKHETNIARKIYFKMESRLLEKYERKLATDAVYWAVNMKDAELYKNELHAKEVHFVPVFLPWEEVNDFLGKGDYCLYHGNLSVNENEKAAAWLITEVFKELSIPLVIAGKSPSAQLKNLVAKNSNTRLVTDPSDEALQDLIQKAHVNILPSFNNTGVKLKLLNALFNGRHCLVNKEAVVGSGLEVCCAIAENAAQFKSLAKKLFEETFTAHQAQQRSTALKDIYNTEKNALKLIAWIY